MAPNVPVQPASIVVTAMVPIRRLPLAEAPSVLPGLNPNQPKARMKQPIRTADMSCPMIGLAEPSRLNLPMRGPTIRRSEEHTSELHSRGHLVCRLLLEKKKDKLY